MLTPTQSTRPPLSRWMTRGLGLLAVTLYGLLIWLALTNEDPPSSQGWPVLACMGLCVAGVFISWRWPRAGGLTLVFASIAYSITAAYSTFTTGADWLGVVVASALPLPFLLLGGLALHEAQG